MRADVYGAFSHTPKVHRSRFSSHEPKSTETGKVVPLPFEDLANRIINRNRYDCLWYQTVGYMNGRGVVQT